MLKQIKDYQHKKKESKRKKEIAKVYYDIEINNGKVWKENLNETSKCVVW